MRSRIVRSRLVTALAVLLVLSLTVVQPDPYAGTDPQGPTATDDLRPVAAGVPEAPVQVYAEDFEPPPTGAGPAPQGLTAAFPEFGAHAAWLEARACNGIWVNGGPGPAAGFGGCVNAGGDSGYAGIRAMATALGGGNAANHAISSFTHNGISPGAGHVQLLSPQVTAPAQRYYVASLDVANTNCFANPAQMRFFVQTSASTADATADRVYLGSPVTGCPQGAQPNTQVSTLTSPGSIRWAASELRMGLVNMTGTGNGNDAAIDNLRLLDATPSLDKAFSPTIIAPGGVSTLTFTITNTTELASKLDWGFTDTLPAGVRVAANPAIGGTCVDSGGAALTRTAAPGSGTISVSGGDLAVGQTSCTITVAVTSATEGTYVNGPANVTTSFLLPPEDATLVVRAPRITLTKALDGPRGRSGDQFAVAIRTGSATGPLVSSTANAATSGTGATVTAGTGTTGTYVATTTPHVLTESGVAGTDLSLYRGSMTCTDSAGLQPGLPRGQAFTGSVALTPVAGANITCVLTNTAVPGALEVTKASDPASGQAVAPGDTVRYTLTFANRGGQPVQVAHDDVLTDVLDDAEVSGVTSSSPDLTAGLISGRLLVSGTVPVGATYTVTYTATVRDPLPASGDGVLDNYLVPRGSTPPATCDASTRLCTTHPVSGDVSVDKAVQGELRPGGLVTYTLTFTHTGGAAAPVAYTDDLAGVLDDADLTAGPTSSDPGVVAAVDTEQISVTGSIGRGDPVTVTYTVRVKATGFGDAVLDNCVQEDGGDDRACTESPIPGDLEIEKTSDPGSGAPLVRGDTVTYTLTFRNLGGAPVALDHVDDLERLLDDAAVVTGPVSSSPDVTAVRDGSTIAITGEVAGGTTVTVTYSAQVLPEGRGDGVLDNVLLAEGETPPGTCEPTPGQLPTCTTHPVPADLRVAKTVDPASGSVVVPGQVLTYTITVANGGGQAAEVDHTDLLAGVLDDAELTSQPVASDPALTVTPTPLGAGDDRFRITGTVPGGASYSVTYQVTVAAAAERGDSVLGNVVVEGDAEPPEVCEPTSSMCTTNPVSEVVVSKSVTPEAGSVEPGAELTYALRFENRGAVAVPVDHTDHLGGVLDDATLTGGPGFAGGEGHGLAVVPLPFTGERLQVAGDLAAGRTSVVEYTVTVKHADRGDSVLDNYLVEGDAPPDGPCDPATRMCTVTPVAELTVAKSVEPASGSVVVPGQVLTYTLTFANTGGAPAAVDHTDHLVGVLDDAELTSQPVASDPALSVAPSPLGAGDDAFAVSGSVPTGSTISVTYQVTVAAADRGDSVLTNVLVEGDTDPPAECEPGSTTCTTNPVSEIVVSKSVDPASGTVVAPGAELTYALRFENRGAVAVAVDHTDHLAGVLDDAVLSGEPSFVDDASFGLALSPDPFSGDRLDVNGELAAGRTAVVQYTVTVKEDGRGDSVLGNFLVAGDSVPPDACDPSTALCTTNPVAELTVVKSVDPASGSVVTPGQLLTYTLTFANRGGVAAPIDHTDHLTGVLDDATLTSGPAFVGPDGGLSIVEDGQTFTVAGDLAPGASVQVTYRVTVAADSDRGDSVLTNVVVEGDGEPPVECVDGSELPCTTNPVADLGVVKSADPASGTTLVPGDEVTYTLTFTNAGAVPAAIDHTDHLAGVLDDAELVGEPAVVGGSDVVVVSPVSDGSFTVRGELAAGAAVQVTYAVQVRAAALRGDSVLGNFLVAGAGDPPAQCTVTTPTCTEHPVADLAVAKSVDPVSQTQVVTGQTLTYRLTFVNRGGTVIDLAHADHLTDVVDDATLTQAPRVVGDAPGVQVGVVDASGFTVTGRLAAGATAVVEYSVVVKAFADRGDGVLANFLVLRDGTPPTTCEAPPSLIDVLAGGDGATCTTNPVVPPVPVVPTDGLLPSTGGPTVLLLLGGLLLLGLGLLLVRQRRRDPGGRHLAPREP
ncbi:LPXTG cell wall anchor domain-containing protein [Aeromicrobium alkaliterrae]|uniref:DUF11 domain-containing protein n=1 Tax=Aeromicrobium alkaliterrae TaxID=302168 RepID=A0ABP4VU38_9ACTN